MDAEGPDLARRYARAAGATFPVLLDQEGLLSSLYRFRGIPNGWVIDENGVIRFRQLGGFDIRKPETAEAIEQTLNSIIPSPAAAQPHEEPRPDALKAFQEGVQLLRLENKRAAVEAWLRAAEADPANFLVRKQIWHLLHPERFEPEVDFAWQRAQVEREERLGIRNANPLPEGLK
jgi:hypothetical protein